MVIFFLRHASAGEAYSNPKRDEKRPLDKLGIEQCRAIGQMLANAEVQIDLIVTSPLKRATQTAVLVGNEIGYEGDLKLDSALRPEARYQDFKDLLRKHSKLDSVIVIGHNPNLSEFCSLLLTEGEDKTVIDLKKGAIARVEVAGKRSASLTWFITPRLVRSIQASVTSRSLPKTPRK